MKDLRTNQKEKLRVPIFLASDDNYVPYLAVTLRSISEHASPSYSYDVKILSSGFTPENKEKLLSMDLTGLNIEIVDVNYKMDRMRKLLSLRLRDYYSESIYYRMFIPSMFPELDKAVYIDCDTVLVSDIAEMYLSSLGKNLLAAVVDETVTPIPAFRDYVKSWVGVPSEKYFNSGVLVMNLAGMRDCGLEKTFARMVSLYNFDTVAPDQDYLNFLCRDRVLYLDRGWNKQPSGESFPENKLRLIHYNMFKKPWRYENVQYEDYFWQMAEKTPFYNKIRKDFLEYTDEKRRSDEEGAEKLLATAARIAERRGGFRMLGEAGKRSSCKVI